VSTVVEASDKHRGNQLSEVRAYSLGIARNRGLMLALGLAGCGTILVGIRYTLISPLFTVMDTIIFIGGFCVYAPCTALLLFVKGRNLYYVVVPWVSAALLLTLALTLNSLFGPNAERLLQDQVPIYIAFVPVIVVFAYTYLTPRHAVMLCGLFSGLLIVAGITNVVINLPESVDSPASMFMLLTLLVSNPAVMGMMHLTRELHLNANRHLERALANERRRRAAAERAKEIDPVTQVLNREGAIHRIRDWLHAETSDDRQIVLCALMMDGYEAKTDKSPRVEWGQVLRKLAKSLQGALGPGTMVARLGGTQFLVWNSDIDATANLHGIGMQLMTRAKAEELGLQSPPGFSVGVTRAQPGQSVDMLIEAVNFQLFLAHSRGGDQICVSTEVSA
jgi:GGDEF domain-containing protein